MLVSVQPVLGITCKIFSALAFTLMSACLKLSSQFPTGELMFFRSLFAMIPLLLWLRWQGNLFQSLKTKSVFGHFLRGFTGSTSMFCSFAALAYLPLNDAIALGYAAPIIAVVLAALILKEKVRIYRWTAVCVGFVGVLIMLWPHMSFQQVSLDADVALTGVILALLGALFSAASAIQIRRLTKTERVGAIVFYFTLMTTIIGFSTIIFGWRMPTPFEFCVLALSGVLGGIGQILLTESYSLADMSVIVPFEYTTMIWAVALGWFIFGELPSATIITGGVIVAMSGIFIVWRERQLGITQKASLQASSHHRPGNG
jgi:Predicted permeases